MTDNIARLLALMGAGGSSGTTDYEALTNKPSIGGVTLIGDITLAELGIVVDDQLNDQSTNPVQNAVLTALLNAFPYANITNKPQINGVTLTGNVTLAQLGLNALWVGTQAEYAQVASTLEAGTLVVITDDNDIDSTPTENSTNMVTSGGVYAFVVQGLNGKVDKVQGKGLSTEDYTTAEKTKLGGIEAEANKTIVDSALDGTSTNPVENQVIKAALDLKANSADLGTAAAKNVPSSGNAANGECVLGSDTRLSDARPASDVSSWAKAANKPSYSYSEITDTPTLGTAASKDVPVSGDAAATEVVMGNDSRLAHIDANGNLWIGNTQIWELIDDVSYAALASKNNRLYFVYPASS